VRTSLFVIALLGAALAGPPAVAQQGEITPQERYELGLKYAKRSNYPKAMEEFNRVRNYHRDDPVSLLAELAIADLYFKQGEYEQARYAYEDFARLHPRHDQLDLVQYRLGLSIYKRAPKLAQRDQTATRQALATWSNFERKFPESEHLGEVADMIAKGNERLAARELAIARFYVKRGAWGAARARAEGLIAKHPDSAYVPEAMALVARSAHAWGDLRAANAMRERLASVDPASVYLKQVDRALAKPAGNPPEDELFPRPYRTSSGSAPPPM
jgi:outer membrane protein assembly factor BamD